jgi:hypothetical protein
MMWVRFAFVMAYDLSKTNNDTDYHSDIDFSADFEKRHCRRNTAHHVSKRVTWNVGGDRGTMRRQRQIQYIDRARKIRRCRGELRGAMDRSDSGFARYKLCRSLGVHERVAAN